MFSGHDAGPMKGRMAGTWGLYPFYSIISVDTCDGTAGNGVFGSSQMQAAFDRTSQDRDQKQLVHCDQSQI